jgi:hypothetical protein
MVFFRRLAAALLVFFTLFCYASNEWNDTTIGFVAQIKNEVVLLYKTPCSKTALARVVPKQQGDWHVAKYMSPAGELTGCWKPDKEVVVLTWSDGSWGVVPQSKFSTLWGT